MLLNDPFSIFQIFMPMVAFAIIIVCCTSACKALQRARQEREEQQERVLHHPSIYILPSNQELRQAPPRYSTVDHYTSPPSYDELELKPDIIPCEPPPAYTERTPSQLSNPR